MNTKVYSGEKVNLIPLPNSIAYKKGALQNSSGNKIIGEQ
jgi:hypothetical protein